MGTILRDFYREMETLEVEVLCIGVRLVMFLVVCLGLTPGKLFYGLVMRYFNSSNNFCSFQTL